MTFSIILILYVLLIVLSLLEDYLGKYKYFAYSMVCVVLILYAGLREVGFDQDSDNYEMYFMASDNPLMAFFAEPSFVIISELCKLVWNDVHSLFLVYALFGISLKFVAIRRLAPCLFFPLLVYLTDIYVLHDLTQIRGGIASAFFLLAIKPLAEGRKKKAALFFLLASLSHYSALVLFPLLFFSNGDLTLRWKIVLYAVVPVCIVLYLLNFDLLVSLPIPYLQGKVEAYRDQADFGTMERNAIIKPFVLIKIVVYYYCLMFSDTIKAFFPTINIMLKIMAASIVTYYVFTYIPVVGHRLSELYGVVEIFMIPAIAYTILPKYAGKIPVILISLVMFVYTFVIWDLLDFTL